ncbi:hypothetical protein FMEAI12_4290008 [Parafrankia sp. Ea1.12]|nr:hypothetical protein FMEAI12_4290008 [Parafrankia sp. Ea1.12]
MQLNGRRGWITVLLAGDNRIASKARGGAARRSGRNRSRYRDGRREDGVVGFACLREERVADPGSSVA